MLTMTHAILEISKLILMDMGNFEIDQVCCVDEALKKLSSKQYDVVVSDYEMPQKDGLQFLKELRKKTIIFLYSFYWKRQRRSSHKSTKSWCRWILQQTRHTETVYGELAHGIRLNIEHKKS